MDDWQSLDPERVLVLAPTAADAALTRSILTEAGLACHLCADLGELSQTLGKGVGAILLTEAVLVASDVHSLVEALRCQPPWSDIPILLLAGIGTDSSVAAWAMELLGNVTVLERPVRITTLVSALRTALRARCRQYELRNQLAELQQADAILQRQGKQLRLLWEAATVLLTTEQPDLMLKTLFAKIALPFQLDTYFNFMVNEAGDALRLESYLGISEAESQKISRLEFGQAICGTVARQRQSIVATHIQQSDDPRVQLVKGYGLRAYACNPLIAEGRLLGTLSFASRRRDQFDAEELEFLQTICQYITVAYERIRLIQQLRDTDRRKDEFLAMLAHELRNPLTPIRSGLHVLRKSADQIPTAARIHAMMERQVDHLVRLVDDLLEVSRITRSKIELRKERVDLAAILDNAIDLSQPLIAAEGHQLTRILPPDPLWLKADPVRLAQVFANLLNNAAKYTAPGGQIHVTVERQGGKAVVSIRDTGAGIPPEMLPRVFDLFTQVNRSGDRAQSGLGIGLFLVRRLVELHGGRVEARSDGPGQGSEFVVSLPLVATLAEEATTAARSASAPGAAQRVLVVDDSPDVADSTGLLLGSLGIEVQVVYDGPAALQSLATFQPAVVLLDLGMPGMDGFEVARRIRQHPAGQAITLVALTGWGQEQDRRRTRQAGFDQHLVKPVDPEALQAFLASLKNEHR